MEKNSWFWLLFWLLVILAELICGWMFMAILVDSISDLARPTPEVTIALFLVGVLGTCLPFILYRCMSAIWLARKEKR